MSGVVDQVRRPRLRVLANGAEVLGAKSAEVYHNGYLQSDRFRVCIATGPDTVMTPAWWSNTDTIQLDIQIGLLPPGAAEGTAAYQSFLIGNVDQVDIDPFRGEIRLEGRDLSSLLMEAKTQETFANQTSSQIATTLAQRHGLTPSVRATTTLVGQYYELEHDRITLNQFSRTTTEWGLLTNLAQSEGFDVWVRANTLYFQPPPTGETDFTITYTPGPPIVSNVTSLRMERNLTLAKDIQVTVKSWNTKHKTAFTRVVKARGAHRASDHITFGTTAQNYDVVVANKTPDECLKIGYAELAARTKHERILAVDMPGETVLSFRSLVSLTGTGTSWDQTYYIAEIEREISVERGFTQRMRLKNGSPRTTTVIL